MIIGGIIAGAGKISSDMPALISNPTTASTGTDALSYSVEARVAKRYHPIVEGFDSHHLFHQRSQALGV